MRSSEATRRRRERKKAEILKRLQTPKDNGTLGEGEYIDQPINPKMFPEAMLQHFTFTPFQASPLLGKGEYYEP